MTEHRDDEIARTTSSTASRSTTTRCRTGGCGMLYGLDRLRRRLLALLPDVRASASYPTTRLRGGDGARRRGAARAGWPRQSSPTSRSLLMATIPAQRRRGAQDLRAVLRRLPRSPGGEGSVGPNLTDAYWIHGGAPLQIHKTVTNGVPDKGMVAWGDQLGPGARADGGRLRAHARRTRTCRARRRRASPRPRRQPAPRRRPPRAGEVPPRGRRGRRWRRTPRRARPGGVRTPTSRRRSRSTRTARATSCTPRTCAVAGSGARTSSTPLLIAVLPGAAVGQRRRPPGGALRHPAAARRSSSALTFTQPGLLPAVLPALGRRLRPVRRDLAVGPRLVRLRLPADGVPGGRVPPHRALDRGTARRAHPAQPGAPDRRQARGARSPSTRIFLALCVAHRPRLPGLLHAGAGAARASCAARPRRTGRRSCGRR